MKINKLTHGLFNYRGKYFYKNIKDFFIMIKRIFYVLKHGYYPQAKYETFSYFIDMYNEIFNHYLNNRKTNIPIGNNVDDYALNNENLYLQLIDYLKIMDIDNVESEQDLANAYKAKDKFFKLFNEYFYNFWD